VVSGLSSVPSRGWAFVVARSLTPSRIVEVLGLRLSRFFRPTGRAARAQDLDLAVALGRVRDQPRRPATIEVPRIPRPGEGGHRVRSGEHRHRLRVASERDGRLFSPGGSRVREAWSRSLLQSALASLRQCPVGVETVVERKTCGVKADRIRSPKSPAVRRSRTAMCDLGLLQHERRLASRFP
jgi:hypothetical protein